MTSPQRRAASVFSLLVLVGVLSGCGTTMGFQMGIRPTEPKITERLDCEAYTEYAEYAQQLQEAYHSRSSQNRAWLYVAAILGLGVMAASGGLAAASAATVGTLGLLSISGAFAAGSFATINNEALALSYTVAANSVDKALADSRLALQPRSCTTALSLLVTNVSEARTHLEVARTDNAAGALARAKDAMKLLSDQIAAVQAASVTVITLEAEITAISPPFSPSTPQGSATQPTAATLTVRAKLGQGIGVGDVKVALGGNRLPAGSITQPDKDDPNTFAVTFTAPAAKDLADPTVPSYNPELIIQGKTRVKSAAAVKFTYPSP
jgi:hypothetical protein